jgi:hypothetical protein
VARVPVRPSVPKVIAEFVFAKLCAAAVRSRELRFPVAPPR